MLLYTIMPIEAVFPPDNNRKLSYRQVRGGFVEVEKTPEGEIVSRIDSTDPGMYLKGPKPGDKYRPGC